MRISDGSSDVCSSDLRRGHVGEGVLARDDLLGKAEDTRPVIPRLFAHPLVVEADDVRVRAVINREGDALALALIEQRGELQDVADSGPAKTIQALVVEIGRASCRERVGQYGVDLGCRRSIKKQKTKEHQKRV